MYEQPKWGTVNLGVETLQGHGEQSQPGKRDYITNHPKSVEKQEYNPGRNQELDLPPDIFRMEKESNWNPYSQNSQMNTKGIHERIKELMGEGHMSAREAKIRAWQEAKKANWDGISKKEVYRSKYQAEEPSKKVSVFSSQVQGYPYL